MIKNIFCFFSIASILSAIFLVQIPHVATTFSIADATAKSVVNFILSASTAASAVSLIGIVFGFGGFTLAAVQTVKYFARKSFVKAVAW